MVLTSAHPLVIDLAPELESTGTFCLFGTVTGRPCPTCGGTRAVANLVTLDIEAAINHNLPVTLGVMVALLIMAVQWKRVATAVRQPRAVTGILTSAGTVVTRHPIVVGSIYLVMWAWNVARW